MKKIQVGTLTKTQGLKGEFRLRALSEYVTKIPTLKTIFINNNEYHIKKIVDRGGFYVIAVEEFTHINQMEHLVNSPIYALVDESEKPDTILNYVIMANNKQIGVVTNIDFYGAADVVTLDNGKELPVSKYRIKQVRMKYLEMTE